MTLNALAKGIGLRYDGPPIEIEGIGTLKNATESQLSFFDNPNYLADLRTTGAGAVLVASKFISEVPEKTVALVTDEPYLKLALASAYFAPKIPKKSGQPPRISPNCHIGEGVHFGKDVVIEEGVTIMSGSYIGDGVHIDAGSFIHPNVTIYHGCRIGRNCIIHAGTVIGSDGYGYAHTKTGEHVKIHQLGGVVIEDDVEIGANTAIDRGAIEDTVIKKGAKIDNLVQIAHNCIVGEHSLLTAQVGLAGSAVLERNVVMGGQSGAMGHICIGPFAQIAAKAGVTKSLKGGKTYAGYPIMEHKRWLKLNAMLSRMLKSFQSQKKEQV